MIEFTKVNVINSFGNKMPGVVAPGPCPDWDYSGGTSARKDIHLYFNDDPVAIGSPSVFLPIFTHDTIEVIGSTKAVL